VILPALGRNAVQLPKLLLVVGLLVAADDNDTIKKEKEKLKGDWTVASLHADGKDAKEEEATFTFAGDKLTVAFKDSKQSATYTIDPAAQPKTIDIVPEEGPEKGKTIKGIYTFDDDGLKICAAASPDKDRPKEFAAKKGSGSVLIVLKKDKP
jgi:uncharacterized protein (TIGR03067 family)